MKFTKRTELLFGKEAIDKFRTTKVAIMGLGGVGSYACEMLARSGIGKFLLVDFDTVGESNINRQLPALQSTVGKFKTEVMKQRIMDINPNAEVEEYRDFVAKESRDFLLEKIDFVVDAIDSLGPKVGLLAYVFKHQIPVISILGAAGRIDPSQIELCDISKSKTCPLAKRVRKFLRRQGVERGVPVIYSSEVPIPQFDHTAGSEEEWASERGRKRGTLSSVGYMPAIMGMWASSYVLRNIAFGYSIYKK